MTKSFTRSFASVLALAVLSTVGVESSFAQKGKFGGFSRGRSSNNSNNNNSGRSGFSFNNNSSNNNSSQFNASNNNSQQNSFGNSLLQNKSFGKSKTNNQPWNNNTVQGLNRDQRTTQSGNQNGGGLQKFLGNKLDSKLRGNDIKTGGDNVHPGNNLQNFLNDKLSKGKQNGNFGGLDLHKNGGKTVGNLLHRIQHNQQQGKLCVGHQDWCHAKPKKCHWWYHWCKPIAYCEPQHQVHCTWNYVNCDYLVGGQVVHADARWYLGLKGMLLPGQGVGIEEVAPGSPAAAVGLQPGMVITRCNGIDLVDETALQQAIAASGGVLQMDLRLSAEGPPATCVVVMQRVTSVNF